MERQRESYIKKHKYKHTNTRKNIHTNTKVQKDTRQLYLGIDLYIFVDAHTNTTKYMKKNI